MFEQNSDYYLIRCIFQMAKPFIVKLQIYIKHEVNESTFFDKNIRRIFNKYLWKIWESFGIIKHLILKFSLTNIHWKKEILNRNNIDEENFFKYYFFKAEYYHKRSKFVKNIQSAKKDY